MNFKTLVKLDPSNDPNSIGFSASLKGMTLNMKGLTFTLDNQKYLNSLIQPFVSKIAKVDTSLLKNLLFNLFLF